MSTASYSPSNERALSALRQRSLYLDNPDRVAAAERALFAARERALYRDTDERIAAAEHLTLPPDHHPILVQTQGREAAMLTAYLALVIELVATARGWGWKDLPAERAKTIAAQIRTFWAAFPAATLIVYGGRTMIDTGTPDAQHPNPLPDYLLFYGNDRMVPRS